ncbi:transferase activity protein [[Candida] boidinii]|nr:transferase activity protein [[Candida] boidinii]
MPPQIDLIYNRHLNSNIIPTNSPSHSQLKDNSTSKMVNNNRNNIDNNILKDGIPNNITNKNDVKKSQIIYNHSHCKNSMPLNVTDAHILDTKESRSSSTTSNNSNTNNSPIHDHQDFDPHNELLMVETRDIILPNHNDPINQISIDIGGSLAKIIYFTQNINGNGGGKLNFYSIETSKIDKFIEFIKLIFKKNFNHDCQSFNNDLTIMATGGGSIKFYDLLKKNLNCNIQKEDEMQCLIIGLDFLITQIPNEIFYFDDLNHKYIDSNSFQISKDNILKIYPYLLVNIGSGVSMIKVTGPEPDNFVRVGGSSLGGGTLWGLLSILTNANNFDEMLSMASMGNNENVDLLVGDIYGKGYNKIGLKSNHIASSMGKVFKKVFSKTEEEEEIELREREREREQEREREAAKEKELVNKENEIGTEGESNDRLICLEKTHLDERIQRLSKFQQEDIARSVLYAVSNNIGQIAYLQAQRYNLKNIYFAGSYIRGHYQTIRTLSYAIDFWSNGSKTAFFLKHEGYLGSMGAFLNKEV